MMEQPRRNKGAPSHRAFDPGNIASIVAGRMSVERQEVVRRLGAVKSHYVESGRDAYVEEQFETFTEEIFAVLDDGMRDEGRLFLVTGESGAGKTAIVRRVLAESEVFQPIETDYGTINPVITVRLSGPCTLGTLGRRILKAAGYPLRREISVKDMWEEMSDHLMTRGVMLVHLDETQHMVHLTEKDQDRKNLAKALKDVVNKREWPVSFLLTGLPHTNQIASLDPQIARRGYFLELPTIAGDADRDFVERAVREFCEVAGIAPTGGIGSDMPERIVHVADGQFGRACQVIAAAIHEALKERGLVLTRAHFAQAYWARSHSVPDDAMNPFLVDDFRRILPGTFLNAYEDET